MLLLNTCLFSENKRSVVTIVPTTVKAAGGAEQALTCHVTWILYQSHLMNNVL